MSKIVKFNINPRLYFYNDDSDKTLTLKNKNLDKKLKEKIINDLKSNKFKNYLNETIFEELDSENSTELIKGKIVSVIINSNTIRVILKVTNSISNKNIIKIIKENINHVYRSRGHYKTYKFLNYEINIDLSLNGEKDTYIINNFSIVKSNN